MADGILNQAEETRQNSVISSPWTPGTSDSNAAAQLSRASTDRITLDSKLAAVAVDDSETHLNEMSSTITQPGLNPNETTALLTRT